MEVTQVQRVTIQMDCNLDANARLEGFMEKWVGGGRSLIHPEKALAHLNFILFEE